MNKIEYAKGLEGVIAAETEICQIVGGEGQLYFRGYSIEEIVEHCSYEEVCYLLLHNELPNPSELKVFSEAMRKTRKLNEQTMNVLKQPGEYLHPMEVLQSAVLHMRPDTGPSIGGTQSSAVDMLYLVTQMSSAVATLYRFRSGQSSVEPRSDLSHGANFLYMMLGTEPSEREGIIMDKCFSLHAEHGFNASTFTARVVASTISTYPCSLSAAVGALYGLLHGGANERVMQILTEINTLDAVDAWVDDAFAKQKKISGFGHRLYRKKDPRSVSMEKYLDEMASIKHDTRYRDILFAIEKKTLEKLGDKQVYPNVDFFSGTVYHLLGIPKLYYTPIFAAARTIGWLAHIQEQMSNNRLFRPKSLYVGNAPRKMQK